MNKQTTLTSPFLIFHFAFAQMFTLPQYHNLGFLIDIVVFICTAWVVGRTLRYSWTFGNGRSSRPVVFPFVILFI